MSEFTDLRDKANAEAQRCRVTAKFWGGFNGAAVVTAALLAGAAAVTAASDVPTWITTATAGVSAMISALTAGFRPAEARNTKCELHAGWERLAERWTQVEQLRIANSLTPGEWLQNLRDISSKLDAEESIPEDTWKAARVPAPAQAPVPA